MICPFKSQICRKKNFQKNPLGLDFQDSFSRHEVKAPQPKEYFFRPDKRDLRK